MHGDRFCPRCDRNGQATGRSPNARLTVLSTCSACNPAKLRAGARPLGGLKGENYPQVGTGLHTRQFTSKPIGKIF